MSEYMPCKGWFDLSKLDLPKKKFERYAKLQKIGQFYQETYQYQKKYNPIQLSQIKEMCAEMSMDLILNYKALESENT